MAETRKITLTEENWQEIDMILAKLPNSDFLRFCLMNDIVEKGIIDVELFVNPWHLIVENFYFFFL